MAKVTKKAKTTKVTWEKVTHEVGSYTCPSCKTTFRGFISDRNVMRLRCTCGQELIVKE